MRLRKRVLCASIALAAVVGTGAAAAEDVAKRPVQTPEQAAAAFADTVDEALVRAVSSVSESSVAIWNNQEVPASAEPGSTAKRLLRVGGGSGVIVSWKGKGPYVITNEHVIKDATKIEVVPCGGVAYEARLLDHVPQYDIALLAFLDPKAKVGRSAKLGKSEDLKEGQWVIATGNPFFLGSDGHCVATLGVVSGLERTLRAEFTYANAIQHDAEVNPGNSGGPLWNLAGELVGINGMIATHEGGGIRPSNTGASFAIPLHLILKYFDDLLSDKVTANAGYLGLDVSDAKDKDGNGIGCRVDGVKDDSPAKRTLKETKVAILRGDVITRLSFGSAVSPQNHDIHCAADFVNALSLFRAGERVRVSFERTKTKMTWNGTLAVAVLKEREPK